MMRMMRNMATNKKTYPCRGQFNGQPCNGTHAPHQNGMCALAGVNELRDLIIWVNYRREDDNEAQTAEQLLAAFRKARDAE